MPAAIYTRISSDKTGAGLGVERQESDCRDLAKQQDLDVLEVYSDNDWSAYSGKPRPAYEQLLVDLAAGKYDAVIVWHQDRLLRRTMDLEKYIAVCEGRGIPTFTVRAGTVDLATPSGRAVARTLAAWSAYEVETSTARVKSAKLQAARAGKWAGGQRPFGYEPGCTAIREEEAAVVRDLVDRVIGGASFNSLAIELNDRGIRTTHGKLWNALKVSNMLSHARYAGLRDHLGTRYPAEWLAIISPATFELLESTVKNRSSRIQERGPARKYLLSGYVVCGKCGKRLNTCPTPRGNGTTDYRYTCPKKDAGNGPGCGGIRRLIEPVDLLVTECILYRLDSAEFAHELESRSGQPEAVAELQQTAALVRVRLDDVAREYMDGSIPRAEYDRLVKAAEQRLDDLEKRITP